MVLGLAATLAFAISSRSLDGIISEVLDYFECERSGVNSGESCDRSGFERLTNPEAKTLGYTVLALYPVITLIYFVRTRRKENVLKQKASSKDFLSRSSN